MILHEHEDRLSDVPRWCIVRTIQKQSVMDHSARVAIVAPRIAIKYFSVAPDDCATLYNIVRWALLHDRPEAFSGDIPTPAKKWWMGVKHDNTRAYRFIEHPEVNDLVRRIVKAADFFEALVFLAKEKSLGNKALDRIWDDVAANFRSAFVDSLWIADDLIHEAEEYEHMQQDPL